MGGIVLKEIHAPDHFYPFIVNLLEKNDQELSSDLIPFIIWNRNRKVLEIEGIAPYKEHLLSFISYTLRHRLLLTPQYKRSLTAWSMCRFSVEDRKNSLCYFSITIEMENEEEADQMIRIKSMIEEELIFGLQGEKEAEEVLGFKPLGVDNRSYLIQEKIAHLMRGHSKDFGSEIMDYMRRFLVHVSSDFIEQREPYHVSRVIFTLFIMQKLLEQKIKKNSLIRHHLMKFLKNGVQDGKNKKSVLAILFSWMLQKNEVFDREHFLRALQKVDPSLHPLIHSYYEDKSSLNGIHTIYLEVERNGMPFHEKEIQKLRMELPVYAMAEIEKLIHPIFMPRNEEEILKNISVLADELKYVDDIPQVIIQFDQQNDQEIGFSIILARIVKPSVPSVEEILSAKKSVYKIVLERSRVVGKVRKKYPKEVLVFRLLLPAAPYLREDHSLDIHKARQEAYAELLRLFQDLRDYNGGMIFKQNQAYESFKRNVKDFVKGKELFVEKFFYAIRPVEALFRYKMEIHRLFLLALDAAKRTSYSFPEMMMYNESAFFVFTYPSLGARSKLLEDFLRILHPYLNKSLFFESVFLEITYAGYIIFPQELGILYPELEKIGLKISNLP
ncbi:MAG: hypothetical protein JW769_02225 [Parachlamydiales bacterium]|nr:hypothetical protein [Parachlamydiales bacterium]